MSIGFKNYPQRLKSVRCGYLFLSIPYGKGKGIPGLSIVGFWPNVSIPYGKGKDGESRESNLSVLYQSPMGKVKIYEYVFTERITKRRVSIPYGKGKEQHLVLCLLL